MQSCVQNTFLNNGNELLKPGKPLEHVTSNKQISLLPSLSTLFEKLLLKRLKPIEARQHIPEHQFGFWNKHSTIEQVHRVTNVINNALEEKKYCCEAFIDRYNKKDFNGLKKKKFRNF